MRALLIDLDGVLRHRDPAVVAGAERDAGLAEGAFFRAAFEPELLNRVVTGLITQEQWEAELCRVLPAETVRKVLGDVGYVDPDVLEIVDDVRTWAKVCLVMVDDSAKITAAAGAMGMQAHTFTTATALRARSDLFKTGVRQ